MKTQVRFVVAGDTHSPWKQFCAALSVAVADSDVQFNIIHRRHSCVSIAVVVTRTRHHVQ
jgi:hypothetical protein